MSCFPIIELSQEDQRTEELYDCVYENFIEEVDAVDNGINDRDGEPRWDIKVLYNCFDQDARLSCVHEKKHVRRWEGNFMAY